MSWAGHVDRLLLITIATLIVLILIGAAVYWFSYGKYKNKELYSSEGIMSSFHRGPEEAQFYLEWAALQQKKPGSVLTRDDVKRAAVRARTISPFELNKIISMYNNHAQKTRFGNNPFVRLHSLDEAASAIRHGPHGDQLYN